LFVLYESKQTQTPPTRLTTRQCPVEGNAEGSDPLDRLEW